MFDFDNSPDRRGTSSVKWNIFDEYKENEDMLPFWIADTDYPTVPEVVEALKKRLDHPIFGYSEPTPSVYKAIQGWWKRRYDWEPDTDWMLITNGVVIGIYFSIMALTKPEDKVLTLTPVYDPFFSAVKNSGRELVYCQLDHEDNYYTINWERLENEFKAGVKAIVFCNPHNPVGRVWTEDELRKLTDLCAKYDVWIFSDEVHADYGLSYKYTPMGKFEKIHDKLVIFTSVAKTFNLAGFVCACVIAPNEEVRKKVRKEYRKLWLFGPSELAFVAIEAAYSNGDAWMDAVLDYLRENVKLVNEYFADHMPKINVTKHEGTFLMWIDMRAAGMNAGELLDTLSGEFGVALGNGEHYGEQADGFVRFNVGATRDNLKKGLERIEAFYNKYVD